MNEAKVGVFDDDPAIRSLISRIVELDLHKVVIEAAGVQEAIKAIEALQDGEIEVALVDGNLDGPEKDGSDGELIASLLREKFSRLVVLGISGAHELASVHRNIGKAGILDLGSIINDLPDAPDPQATNPLVGI